MPTVGVGPGIFLLHYMVESPWIRGVLVMGGEEVMKFSDLKMKSEVPKKGEKGA